MDLVNKYRPTKLAQVVGQDSAVQILRGVLKRRTDINPVTLFCGPHSTGKTTLAWLLALYANCKNPQEDGEACRECDSCMNIIRAIKEGRNGQAVIEKAVSERGIDAIRQLEAQAEYKSQFRYRWFILDEAHNLTKQAFDAALRLFEKPPKQTRFVLCTTDPSKFPATIISRSFVFNLQPIAPDVTAKKLLRVVCKREGFDLNKDVLLQIAQAVQGHPRDALNLLTQVVAAGEGGMAIEDLPRIIERSEASLPYLVIKKYMVALLAGKAGTALMTVQHLTNADYFLSQIIVYLQQILYWWISPELVVPPYDRNINEIKPPPRADAAKHIDDLGRLMTICLDAQHRAKQYTNDGQAVVEAATIQMASITKRWKS
jgi:DNA polymerase III subunit gamma/tau